MFKFILYAFGDDQIFVSDTTLFLFYTKMKRITNKISYVVNL